MATAAGVIVAGLCIAAVEALGHWLYAAPTDLNIEGRRAMAAYVAELPVGALLFVLTAWLLGAVVGGRVAALIAQRRPRLYGGLIAALILGAAVFNFSQIPHPPWFIVLSLLCLPLAGFVTGRLAAAGATQAPSTTD